MTECELRDGRANRLTGDAGRISGYRTRRTFGHRWRGYLALVLLVGSVGGIGLAALAGARRTQSSYSTFLASTHPSDLDFSINVDTSSDQLPDIANELAKIPNVRHVGSWIDLLGAPLSRDGVADLNPVANIQTMGSAGGLSFSQDRLTAVNGRRADPNRAHELMVTPAAAQLLHARVGQVVRFGFFTPAQAADHRQQVGVQRVRPHVTVDLRVVGIVDQNTGVVQDQVDRIPTVLVFTPALTRRLLEPPASLAGANYYGLQLKHGADDVAEVERAIVAKLPPGTSYNFRVTSLAAARVDQAIRPDAIALGVFGTAALLAAVLLGLQAVGREVQAGADDVEVLRALGAGPISTSTDGLVGVLAAVVVASLLSVVLAVALSPLFPIGPVRAVYPDRGVDVDVTVLAGGLAVFTVVIGLAAILIQVRNAPHRVLRRERRHPAQSTPRWRLRTANRLPVVAAVGIDFAVDPGRSRTSASSRSVIAGAVLAVALIVTTLTFGASLQSLVSHPALYGWNWSYAFNPNDGVPPAAVTALDHDPLVAAWSGYDDPSIQIDGTAVPVLFARGGLGASPPILSGHTVDGRNQIVLGGATLAQLHKHVGDEVRVAYGTKADPTSYVAPRQMRIVGTATLPAIGYSFQLADHTSMGTGAMLSVRSVPERADVIASAPDPVASGPALVFVRLKPGVSAAAGRADLDRVIRIGNRQQAADRAIGGGVFTQLLGVQRPAEIVNYRSMRTTPALLTLALDLGAILGLFVGLTASVRRRRRTLAVMKSMGCTGRQIAGVIAWQSSIIAIIGVAVGVPIGIVAGRQLWIAFARSISVVPRPAVPVSSIVVVGVVAVVLANLVAAIPGRSAARTPPASLLRGE